VKLVVLDTNVLISALLSQKGAPIQLLRAWRSREFNVAVSEAILDEYKRVIAYGHLKGKLQFAGRPVETIISEFQEFGILIEPSGEWPIVPGDPDDAMILACAVAGRADFIVSGDRHLLDLGQYQGVRIFTPAAFLLHLRYGESF
jgi:hypothetical protein